MRFIVLTAAVFLLAVVFAVPRRVKRDDNCGLISGPKGFWEKIGQASGPWCEICLDLIEIVKTYEECGEEMLHKKLDEYCGEKFGNGTTGALCRSTVDDLAHEIIDDTENVNSTGVCDAITKDPDCNFRENFVYKLY